MDCVNRDNIAVVAAEYEVSGITDWRRIVSAATNPQLLLVVATIRITFKKTSHTTATWRTQCNRVVVLSYGCDATDFYYPDE